MKILALNIGNTTLLGTLSRGAKPGKPFKLPSAGGAAALIDLLTPLLATGEPVQAVVLCSVVPRLTPAVCDALRKLGLPKPKVLTADAHHGLVIGYREPGRLGTDRLAAAVGARALFPGKNLIVLDCGTASTVTALNAKGRLCGGAILPGLGLWAESLGSRTAQLPTVTPAKPKRPTGRSPEEAIASGLYHGHLGALEGLSAKIAEDSFGDSPFEVIATGGNSKIFRREKLFTHIEPNLILTGLLAFASIQSHDA